MKTKFNVMKKLLLFSAAVALCLSVFAKPVDVKAALAAPTTVVQTGATYSSLTVQWTPVSGAYKYGITTSTDANFADDYEYTTSSGTSYTYTGLNEGTTYYVRVRAFSSYSSDSYGAAKTIKADTAPDNFYSSDIVQTNATTTSVTVTWPAATGATGYLVLRAGLSDAQYTTIAATTARSYTIPVAANTPYDIAIVPFRNAANANNRCAETRYVYPRECVPAPTAPKKLSVVAGSYKGKWLEFYWQPTSSYDNTDGYEVTPYYLTTKGKLKKATKAQTKSGYGYTQTGKSTVFSYIDIKSSKFFKYPVKFKVRAYVTLPSGKKVYGPSVTMSKPYIPQAPQKSLKFPYRGSKTATLKWSKVSGASSYTIYYKTKEKGKWKAIKKNVKGTKATVKANYYGYSYYYIKANKVKVGSKKYNSASASKAPYIQYWY